MIGSGSKPNWKYAPSAAKYLACDRQGDWYWYEEIPYPVITDLDVEEVIGYWDTTNNVWFAGSGPEEPHWLKSLEDRP